MAVDGHAVDLVDTEHAGGKCRHRNRWRDDRIDLAKDFQERRAQFVAAIAGLDIFDAAVDRALRHHVTVIAVGIRERAGVTGRDRRRLLGIGDWFEDALEHVGFEPSAIGHDDGAE